MICSRIGELSWFLFIFLTCAVSPIRGTVNKQSRRIRRSGPNVCGGQNPECCSGWQPAAVDQRLCIQPICNFNCGTGVCVRPNLCLCENGQYNPSCTQSNKDCKVRCLNGGTCRDDKCQCPQGFEGRVCENPVCEKPCQNGGQCIAPNTCACLFGFAGPQCQSDFRQGPCYKEIKDLKCQGQVSTLICTKELCCATVGKAWGMPCEQCPAKTGPCAKGYLPDYESRECLDIDECKAVPGVCGENGKCINTVGSYRCEKCDVGFKYSDKAGKCVDIDECADKQTNQCLNGRCINTNGSFRCVCGAGYILSANGSSCKKTGTTLPPDKRQDLCFQQLLQNACHNPISDNVTRAECCCSNIAGAGWSPDCERCPLKDSNDYKVLCRLFDECTIQGEECHNGVCKRTETGMRCICDIGYTFDTSLEICVDIDECEDGGLMCVNALCINTVGNFVCECKEGFIPGSNRVTCVPVIHGPSPDPMATPSAPPSVSTSRTVVGDCSSVGQRCENGMCAIVDGMLRCSCNAGFKYVQGKCVDKNECAEDSDICDNGVCVNEVGGYRCECAAGYRPTSDQKSCVDRNECTDAATCANGQCTNTVGAWRCTCNKGFALSIDEKSCIDIDECTSIVDVCMNGICMNTAGDYFCKCNTGYSQSTDKHMCLDTMESQCYASYSNNVCSQTLFRPLTISQCCCGKDNTAENLRAWGNPCMPCPAPNSAEYRKVCVHGSGKDSGGKDIDECSNNVGSQTKLCINGRCQNTNGDYVCACDTGYRNTANKKECVEVNECSENPALCRRGRCVNTPGSYRCVCPKGYVFDSRTKGCEDENECANENQCIDGTCINTMGSFRCQCPEELTLHENGRWCQDLRKGKCWRSYSNGVCEDNVNGDVTQEVCCQTLGKAWGSPCQKCPTKGVKCQRGYRYNNFTCIDIDECDSFAGICRNGRCINTPGSYRCECSEGFTLDQSRSVCLDEREAVCYQTVTRDECAKPVRGVYKKDDCCCSLGAAWGLPCEECPLRSTRDFDELCRNALGELKEYDECNMFPGICSNGECINTRGGFLCECRPGFALDETGKNCTDINECEITPGLCGNGTCINTPGGFRCNCEEGFKNAPMMMEICIDVDECDDISNPCQGGTCVNTIGSFKCDCPPGKRMDPSGLMCIDINECAEDSFICVNGNCQNFMGGYQCACFRGFESSDNMKTCIDIDECKFENGRCEALCENTIGSYRCSCPPGLRLQNDGKSCADINECIETPEICGVGNKCQNVYAGHECVCSDAYTLSEDRKSCIDIDECVSNPDLCLNGECQNLLGSFRCICGVGYVLDEGSSACVDVDECDSGLSSTCGSNAFCVNSVGSYSCQCKTGFEKSDDICQDINECAIEGGADRCGENAVCINTEGSFRCECEEGYSLARDGSCKDVDECGNNSSVCANGKCLNMPGSYECECEFGYFLTTDRKACQDLDECEAMKEFCHHGRCENIPGSFRCICDKGFQLNRYQNNCTDTNECAESGMCLNGRCVNEMGKYRCECDRDFEPNPTNTACIDTRTGPCLLTQGPGPNSCSNIVADDVLRSRCCCSVGAAWNNPCEECPKNGTDDYKHLCPSGDGFVVDPYTTSLIDINECAFPNICVNGTCINTLGSFRCTCSRGFEYKKEMGICDDINECKQSKFPCGLTGVCINTIGSYFCECPPFEVKIENTCFDQRPQQCFKDVQDPDNIEGSAPGSSCNESLSYRDITRAECCCSFGTAYGPPDMCKLCPVRGTDAFNALCGVMKPMPPDGPRVTPFPPGGTPGPPVRPTTGVPVFTDVDECSFVIEPCGMGRCVNTYGSYRCECDKGFAVRGKIVCEDINECLVNPCENGQCKNTFGSFMCSCRSGYVVDETGLKCVDHNECHLNDTCTNGVCVNLVGGHRCLCNRGYKPTRGSKACVDVDECSNGFGRCKDGTCINTPGSYSCRCNEGFREDSRHNCRDIDECAELHNQICRNGVCRNTVGRFLCTCNIGYTLDDTGRNCRDLNECREVKDYCLNGTCTNTIGGSKCECTNGFSLHPAGDKCVDINECEEDPNLCQMDGTCINTAGSFVCRCPAGYKVANNGKMCVDMRQGYCFDNTDNLSGCTEPQLKFLTKQTCCCTKGAGWGEPCYVCPREQTREFNLLCPKGPGYAVKNDSLQDVNECENNPKLCQNGRCINSDGSYRCQCFAGYELDESGRNCRDINECLTPGICGNGTCTNIPGSYTCACAVGFQRGRSSPSCQDIDECFETKNLCAFRCVNVPGAYRCICPRGYKLHADGRHCTDVDECVTGIHNCGYVCKNIVGSFKCVCPEGFRRAAGRRCIDINECREDSSRCRNGACRNTAGSYICDCNEGFKRTADGKSCEDLRRGLCFSQVDNGICKGSTKIMLLVTKSECCCSAGIAWGSQCTPCPKEGTTARRRLCIASRKKEMNECSIIPDLCPNGKCIDTRDSYRCMCNHGYRLSRNGKSCIDVDECARTPKPCRNECENTPGSYKCKCPEGYEQGSTPGTCQDIDECQNRSHNCPQNCVNTVGSYRCTCRQGYRWTGTACADINECTQRQNICGFGSCVNQQGSYTCLCQRGYKYNAQTKTCVDTNECNVRICQGTCVNLNGGYRCGCPSGYVRQIYWNQCVDVNECTTGANKCGRTKCANIRGGYRCYCPQGFQLDRIRMICRDTNECSRNPCATGCYNIRGGFQCTCPTGFYPIGGGHCISRFGQTCYNCASRQTQQRPQSIVTQNKYKFGEQPNTGRGATPARYFSRRTQQNPYRSSWDYYTSQQKQSNPNPYRYTYSYGSSSGQRRKRTSHFVHKLRMIVPRNVTARDNLLVLTPVLESLQKHFHYEILKGNRSLFAIKIKDGVSILYAKKPLRIGLNRVYLKGKLDNTKVNVPLEVKNQIEFTGSGEEKKSEEKTEIPINEAVGVSEANKFHLELFIKVV